MRRFMITTLSSRRTTYHRHLNAFSGSPTTLPGSASPPSQDGKRSRNITCPMRKHRCFMSTQTNPPHHTSIRYNGSNIKGEERVKVVWRGHVKPSSPTPQNLRYYKLSMFDQIEHPIYHPLIFFYNNNDNNNNDKDNNNNNIEEIISDRSNHLKQSLSETLTRMYPFAGMLASELHIDCNDVGAYYIETRVDDRLDNVLRKSPDHKLLKRFLPVVDSVPNQPLLGSYATMVQVNFFSCGGVSIAAQHNHKFADGRSVMTFMNVWASIARRDSNLVYPEFVSSSMFPQNPHLSFYPYIPLWYLTVSSVYIKHGKCETKRFCFDALALRELKTKVSKHEPVSRVVAVLALLWKCVTAETHSKASVLHMPVDIRQQLSPPLPDSSIGNIKSGAVVRFDHGANDTLDVASMASRLKMAIAESKGGSVEELKGKNGHVRFVESVRKSMELMFNDFKSEYYLASSLCNSGISEADFGWGKPVWFCTGNQLNDNVPLFTNRILLADSCSGEGIEAWVTLEKQVMDAVKCNAELLSFASVDPSPL